MVAPGEPAVVLGFCEDCATSSTPVSAATRTTTTTGIQTAFLAYQCFLVGAGPDGPAGSAGYPVGSGGTAGTGSVVSIAVLVLRLETKCSTRNLLRGCAEGPMSIVNVPGQAASTTAHTLRMRPSGGSGGRTAGRLR